MTAVTTPVPVSVVIPTWNAGPMFAATLDAVCAQRDAGDVEIVVLDSESSDGTDALARSAGARVRTVRRATFNHGTTRNLGAALARGTFVAFLTQDAEPADDRWLAALVDALESEQASGAYSRVLPRPGCSPLVRRSVEADLVFSSDRHVRRFERSALESMAPFQRRVVCHFNNVASMVRRAVFERLPFPEIPFGEDLAWGHRVLAGGGSLVYEPSSVVLHSHPSSLFGDFRRHRQDARLMRTLFGIRNRDGVRDCLPAIAREVRADWAALHRAGLGWWRGAGFALYSPLLRASQILGQLAGSRGDEAPAPRFGASLPGVELSHPD